MSPVRRPSHRRRPVDLGTAVTSTEEVASVEVDSGTAAVSAEDVASVEVDSAVLKGALVLLTGFSPATTPRTRKNTKRTRKWHPPHWPVTRSTCALPMAGTKWSR